MTVELLAHVVMATLCLYVAGSAYSSGGYGPGVTGGGGTGGDRCPRCGGAVYMAEKIVGAGSVSHVTCIISLILYVV